jgi:hypothetical protein
MMMRYILANMMSKIIRIVTGIILIAIGVVGIYIALLVWLHGTNIWEVLKLSAPTAGAGIFFIIFGADVIKGATWHNVKEDYLWWIFHW